MLIKKRYQDIYGALAETKIYLINTGCCREFQEIANACNYEKNRKTNGKSSLGKKTLNRGI